MKVFSSIKDLEIINLIKSGGVGVLPTDTVYGLVCDAGNQQAVARLYALKAREHKPGTVIASNLDQLVALGIKRRYLKAVEQFWPGAVSVIVPCGDNIKYLHMGLKGLAIRIPSDKSLQNLLSKLVLYKPPVLTGLESRRRLPSPKHVKYLATRSIFTSMVAIIPATKLQPLFV